MDNIGKVHATNSTKAIPEEHWKNPDAVKQMEDFNESILVKIGNDVKPEDAYFDDEYPDPPLSLFEDNEATQEVTMAEEGATILNIDDRLAESDLDVKRKIQKKKEKEGQGKEESKAAKEKAANLFTAQGTRGG